MSRTTLKSIYSFSSEDSAFPASNLLKNLKWRSQGVGQETEYVTIELEKPTRINGIDLGNESSCFISVFVVRRGQEMIPEKYQEILLSASFMTPIECRAMENTNHVRCFSPTALVEDVAKEKWDFVKIVCSQPFNAHVQYGLSFVTIYSAEEEVPNSGKLEKTSSLRKFLFRNESPDSDEKCGLFLKWKESRRKSEQSEQPSTSTSSAAPVLAIQGSGEDLQDGDSSQKPKKADRLRRNRIVHDSEDSDNDGRTSAKKPRRSEDVPKIKPKKPEKRISYQPFSKLLNGVIFTISGIENPEREDLRKKASAMGARYRPVWSSSCTHLICAFKNTPKYHQVKGSGKIVQKDWILDCYSERIRFPWRHYALDRSERNESDSEDEVHDEARRPPDQAQGSSSRNRIVDSGSDTEDEIQKILAEKDAEKNIYNKDTDEEGPS
uniref:Putative dna repair protein xrcc1 isoform x2 n=1 Tax=Lutzomyia longipalpis TaxID=7200 RepID=A0A1B0CD96_LUTLO